MVLIIIISEGNRDRERERVTVMNRLPPQNHKYMLVFRSPAAHFISSDLSRLPTNLSNWRPSCNASCRANKYYSQTHRFNVCLLYVCLLFVIFFPAMRIFVANKNIAWFHRLLCKIGQLYAAASSRLRERIPSVAAHSNPGSIEIERRTELNYAILATLCAINYLHLDSMTQVKSVYMCVGCERYGAHSGGKLW